MKTPTFKLRRPEREPEFKDGTTSEDDASAEEASASAMEWSGASATMTKAIGILLKASLVAGPLALLLAVWLLMKPPAPPSGPHVVDQSAAASTRAAVGSFAEDFVVTWLSTADGDEKRLGRFLSTYSGLSLPQTPWVVTNPAVSDIRETAGSWSATVAVDVADHAKAPPVRRYFQVPVAYRAGALVAQTLPAPVAGPALAGAPQLAYDGRASTEDPLALAAGEFLRALLVSGGGDVTRYITPGAKIRAVSPAPYTALELGDVLVDQDISTINQSDPKTGTRLRLLVTAALSSTGNRQITVQYALTVTARAGRWEITSINPNPLTSSQSAAAAATTQSPTTEPTQAPSSTPTNE